ncbi:MAG: CehA/McbA family metallohydrolase [Kofleriaceae bacterium]
MGRSLLVACLILAAGCGDDSSSCPTASTAFPEGDPNGHAEPLGAAAGQARAGRLRPGELPAVPSGLATWKEGDFVLANDKVALVIEDAGDSDLYDPWGGKPVGLARVEGGRMVEPNNFGELFLLIGRSTLVTESVTVVADGSDGGPAIVRARGKLHPVPFFEGIISAVFADPWTDIEAAIDYELAPGAEHVDVRFRLASPRSEEKELPSLMHAMMYTKRTPVFLPGQGFKDDLAGSPYAALIDDQATSWAYVPAEGRLGTSLSVSGFLGAFSDGFTMPACGALERLHAKIIIGGPGVDGIQGAAARTLGVAQRAVTGTVRRAGAPVAGVHVHAVGPAGGYFSRATTDANGGFTLHVPENEQVVVHATARGEAPVEAAAGTGSGPVALDLPALGEIRVTTSDGARRIPARVQVLPAAGQALPQVPGHFGEPPLPGGRLRVAFALTGETTLAVPPGRWEVIVSRGYEYELVRQIVDVTAGATAAVDAELEHSVDTTGVQCGDFHIHTWRSNDSGDDALEKVSQAIADGLELPVRSEHEFVADFSAEIAQLGMQAFAAGMGAIELTSFEVWGHMGVFPLTPDPSAVNAGAPRWQSFPTSDRPDAELETLSPPAVFDAVRARPEAPIVIINHPRGGANYFDYVGFDPATGMVDSAADWDTRFTLVEVFNDSSWQSNRNSNVADWMGLLRAGRKVFAVGSSDSHGFVSSPVGYPRTCIALGTDDPRALTPAMVRDRLAAGHSTISGGVYVDARIGAAGPGDTTTGAGNAIEVEVTVRAATWIDVDAIEVVVDGTTVDTIPIMPGDADPLDPTVRWRGRVPVQTAATGGFVVVAAYGDRRMDPVHDRTPFGATNPIFVQP